MMRICRFCNETKPLDNFMFNKASENYTFKCKKCRSTESKLNYQKNKEKVLNNQKKYYQEHKESIRQRHKKWEENNKNKRKIITQRYHDNHKEEEKQRKIERRIRNDETYQKFVERRKKYQREKRNNLCYKLKDNFRRNIRYALESGKDSKYFQYLNYTLQDLLNRLRSTIPNNFLFEEHFLKNRVLQIDHIIPEDLYYFENYEDSEFKKCWNLRNLRLVTENINKSKWNKLIKELIIENNIEDLLPKEFPLCAQGIPLYTSGCSA